MTKHAPVILQLSDTECGIASLAMLFAYYNCGVSLEELRDQCAVGRDGCKAQTLINVATHYGFIAQAWQVDVDTISQLTSPVIAHWNFSHYIVINKVSGDKIYINDPAIGAMTVTRDEFDRAFTGVIINITPGSNTQRRKVRLGVLEMIRHWLSETSLELLFLLLCLLIATISPYLNLSIYSILINQCIIAKNIQLLPQLLLLSAFLYCIFIIATLLYKKIQFKLITNLSLKQSAKTIRHMFNLPLLFYSLRQRSEILAIASRVESIIHILFTSAVNSSVAAITSLICLAFMAKINYLLTLSSITITLFYTVIFLIIARLSFSPEKTSAIYSAKLYAHSVASIKNIETIKACSLQESTFKKWRSFFLNSIMARDKVNTLNILNSTLIKSYHTISLLSILLIGSASVGDLMAYYALHLIFYNKISVLFKGLTDTQNAYAQHNRINDIASYKKDRRHTQPLNCYNPEENVNNAISCSNVTFYYNLHSKPVLKNISLNIKKHQHVAFIGHTGSGKSTLAKLLCALYQPDSGEICLYDKNISSYSSNDLARICAYVSQDVTLFSGTLFQNLRFGGNQMIDDIHTAIKIACLEKLITERGLHAIVEEGGKNFSGGEKQRIDIARALLQNSPVLILDEATSALDDETQSRLIANLRTINKTIIFVAHRLSSIRHCDQIFLFKRGEIIKYEIFSSQK